MSGIRRLSGEARLALVLLTVALLMSVSRTSAMIGSITHDLDLSATKLGLVLGAGGLAALTVVGVAFVVDRRGPHPIMPMGALIAAAGMLLLSIAAGFWSLAAASAVIGLGTAAVSAPILYAVAAKGCRRYRGTVIGGIAFLTTVPTASVSREIAEVFGWRWTAAAFAGLTGVAALGLFVLLPRVFPVRSRSSGPAPAWQPDRDEDGQSWRQLRQTPGFWKVLGVVALVFAFGQALRTTGDFSGFWLLRDSSSSLDMGELLSWSRLATALGALLWGIASDVVPARRLIPAASAMVMASIVSFSFLEGSTAGLLGMQLLGLGLGLGAAVSLPWVLLADHVGIRYFATLGLGVSSVGRLISFPVPLAAGYALDGWGATGAGALLAAFALALALASFRAPRLAKVSVR